MAHEGQIKYCTYVRDRFPELFKEKKVLDVGSLDINGNNRYLFDNCDYTGVDVGEGKNVDVITPIHLYKPPEFEEAQDGSYDFVVSTECFEHDMYFPYSFKNIFRLLKPGGMFMFTCATTGRGEHGTPKVDPSSSPLTVGMGGDWANYYRNVTQEDVETILDMDAFEDHEFKFDHVYGDIYFWGIKK